MNANTESMECKKAFTLIELLVVVAIISILAAILFPVFARARENARRSSCLSNLKQIGIGVMQYVQDYDEAYPLATYAEDGENIFWVKAVQPYIKSSNVFYCPSSPFVGQSAYWNGNYGANRNIIPMSNDDPLSIKMSQLDASANTYMIMDFGTYFATHSRAYSSGSTWEYLPGEGEGGGDCNTSTTYVHAVKIRDDCESGRHFGGVNMNFADGHAKWLKSSIVVQQARDAHAGLPSSWRP